MSLPRLINHEADLAKRCRLLKDSFWMKLEMLTLTTLPLFTNSKLFLCQLFVLFRRFGTRWILLMPDTWRGRLRSISGVSISKYWTPILEYEISARFSTIIESGFVVQPDKATVANTIRIKIFSFFPTKSITYSFLMQIYNIWGKQQRLFY